MTSKQPTQTKTTYDNGWFSISTLVTVATFVLIASFHRIAHEDRLLLNLYWISIAGAAYALVNRNAIAQLTFVVSTVAASTLAQSYLAAKPGIQDPLLDPVIDIVSLSILLLLSWRLAIHGTRFIKQQREMDLQHVLEKQAMATRAAALTATSHEVRTPITAILSITETLLDGAVGEMEPEQKEFIQDVDDCGRHLLMLINDILDYAKAQAGQIKLAPEIVELHNLIDQCVSITEATKKHPGLQLTTQLDSSVREVVADPLRLKQILLNLMSNAVKYSPDNSVVRVQLQKDGEDILISVRDAGRGIAAEQVEHLFDPYYQAAYGDQGIGTGLGLAITKSLVEMHEGSIAVESVVGAGSLFTVRLPGKRALPVGTEVESSSDQNWQSIVNEESVGAVAGV